MLKGRLGLLDGRKWTLEELGQRKNLTREAIRQIEKKVMTVIARPKRIELLNYLWLAVDEILTAYGGVCCINEIAKALQNRWAWTVLPSDESLASFISFSSNYEVIWSSPIRIIIPIHNCVNCKKLGPVLTKAIEGQENGMLSFEEAIFILNDYCRSQACKKSAEIKTFSNGYLYFLNDSIEQILIRESSLYTQNTWSLIKYGKSKTALVENIVYNAGRAMHFKEVHAEANKDRPLDEQLSDNSIYGNLDRSTKLLLWGPGAYIHQDLIAIPLSLISEIENDIISRLNTHNISYLSIT